MSRVIKTAIVGLGRAGWNIHLKAIMKIADYQIVAVADPLPERCQEAADLTGCDRFATIDELLARSTAELVVVATPSTCHYADTLKVLRSGRHCITEKPLAMNGGEAGELVDVSREKGVNLFVNHTYLHRPEYYHLKEIVESGVLGELFHIQVFWGGYTRRWDWQTLKKNGGGQLYNLGPHILSMVLPLLESPVRRVCATMRNIKDAGDAEDHLHLVLHSDSGVSVDIHCCTAAAVSPPRWTIYGRNGALVSDGQKGRVRYYDPSAVPDIAVLDAAAPERRHIKEELPWEEREINAESWQGVSSFHENVRDVLLGKAEQIVTPDRVLEVIRVMDLVSRDAAAR